MNGTAHLHILLKDADHRVAEESKSALERDSAAEPSTVRGPGDDKLPDISISQIRSGRTLGAFDTAFYVALALSFPIGITASVLANWIWERISRVRAVHTNGPVVLTLGNSRIEIHSEEPAAILAAISAAVAPLVEKASSE